MIFGPSWVTLGGGIALTAALAFPYGAYIGSSHEKDKATAALLKATQAARQTEANWQSDAATIEEVHADELRRIAAQHVRDLAGLRSRSARLPETARAACNGATGAELSERDASDLVRLAARADDVRADLEACRAWAQTVTQP